MRYTDEQLKEAFEDGDLYIKPLYDIEDDTKFYCCQDNLYKVVELEDGKINAIYKRSEGTEYTLCTDMEHESFDVIILNKDNEKPFNNIWTESLYLTEKQRKKDVEDALKSPELLGALLLFYKAGRSYSLDDIVKNMNISWNYLDIILDCLFHNEYMIFRDFLMTVTESGKKLLISNNMLEGE